MDIEQWGALELVGATVAYWAALFVGVVLYARWRARQAPKRQIEGVLRQPNDESSRVVETSDSGIVVKVEERLNLLVVGLYLLGPPLVLALIRFWF